MTNQTMKFENVIFEMEHKGETLRGTSQELVERTGLSMVTVRSRAINVGIRHAEIEAYDKLTRKTFKGDLESVKEFLNLSLSSTIRSAFKRGGNMRDYKVRVTGEGIFVPIVKVEPIKKNSVTTNEQVRKHKPVPMSEYAQQLFEHSTRHLRRDA